MKVTLSDIAKETGFSISTVSRALRGIEKVGPGNKKIIIETAKELGYPLQNSSNGMLQDKDSLVALIVGFHIDEFLASFFNGFMNVDRKRNMKVSMFRAPSDTKGICSLIKQLNDTGYSSAVLMISTLNHDDYHQILDQTSADFPLVSCSDILHPVLSTVTFDAYRGGSLVADHFVKRGYKTAGFIEGPPDKPGAQYRKNGFIDTLKQTSNVEFTWSHPGNYSVEAGIKAFNNFEMTENRPRAIFAADDATAVGFMESARAQGYHFPRDIALVGYDNLPICEYHFPTITSVKTDYTKLARVALNTLEAQRSMNTTHEEGLVSMLPVNLEIRESS
jgi:DNA-binding LacI/PurR family transcriptional regulator